MSLGFLLLCFEFLPADAVRLTLARVQRWTLFENATIYNPWRWGWKGTIYDRRMPLQSSVIVTFRKKGLNAAIVQH